MRAIIAGAVLTLALTPSALATHPMNVERIQANLDRDARLESIWLQSSHSASASLTDFCRGKLVRYRIHYTGRSFFRAPMPFAQVLEADAVTRQPEILASFSSLDGATAWATVVHLQPRRNRCARIRRLLTVTTETPPLRIDPSHRRQSFAVYALQTNESKSLEVAVLERWTRADGTGEVRLTVFEYVAPARQYVLTFTETRPVPQAL